MIISVDFATDAHHPNFESSSAAMEILPTMLHTCCSFPGKLHSIKSRAPPEEMRIDFYRINRPGIVPWVDNLHKVSVEEVVKEAVRIIDAAR